VSNVPMVTIIIPCRNYGHHLAGAIESALAQSFGDLEGVVVDYGSTDNTARITHQYSFDSRVRYELAPPGSLGHARNWGLRLARGTYIQFLDADDILLPDKLLMHWDLSRTHGCARISHTDFVFTCGDTGAVMPKYASPRFGDGHFLEDLILRWERGLSIPCHCFLFERVVFQERCFDVTMPNHEDWELYVRLAAAGETSTFVPSVGANYRMFKYSMARHSKDIIQKGFDMALERAERLSERCRRLVCQRRQMEAEVVR